jgi:hypothetical protein
LSFMDDKTNNYVRQIVWNTVEYRWEKKFWPTFLMKEYSRLCTYRNCLHKQFRVCPPFHLLFTYQRNGLEPTKTTTFDKPIPSNFEVKKVSKFIGYLIGLHVLLLASEDFWR